MNIPPYNITSDYQFGYLSSLQKCARKNKGKYYFSKVGIIAEDPNVRKDAVDFFQNYVFKMNGFPSNWTAEPFETEDAAFDTVKNDQDQPFCFAINFKTFDETNNKYDIQYSFNRDAVPDTNLEAFND